MKDIKSNRPIKSLGQNFLTNPYYQTKIVKSLRISDMDQVIEIGPGKGALSGHILQMAPAKFSAVEIDKRWASLLRQKFGDQITLIQKDFLTLNLEDFIDANGAVIKIIGNIPYNITSPILFKLLDYFKSLKTAVLMTQKEVARRITAVPSNKDYGILSVLTQTFAEAEYLFEVKRGNFFPVPNVDSAVLRLNFYKEVSNIHDTQHYRHLVRHLFNYRRKMIRNSLGRIIDKSIVYSLDSIDINQRPENLSVEQYKNLSNEITSKTGKTNGKS